MCSDTIKHLEFIQANIARMGQNSFQMKGWAMTVVTALIALYVASISGESGGNSWFLFVGAFPTLIFWFLDSYYLQQERKFRGVYNDVALLSQENEKVEVRLFEMPLHKYKKGQYCLFRFGFSRTIWPLYLPIAVILIVTGLVMQCS